MPGLGLPNIDVMMQTAKSWDEALKLDKEQVQFMAADIATVTSMSSSQIGAVSKMGCVLNIANGIPHELIVIVNKQEKYMGTFRIPPKGPYNG